MISSVAERPKKNRIEDGAARLRYSVACERRGGRGGTEREDWNWTSRRRKERRSRFIGPLGLLGCADIPAHEEPSSANMAGMPDHDFNYSFIYLEMTILLLIFLNLQLCSLITFYFELWVRR